MIKSSSKKTFVTNLKPITKVIIDGPCEFTIQNINNHGQVELSFLVDRTTFVETFKLERKEGKVNTIDDDNRGNKISTARRQLKWIK